MRPVSRRGVPTELRAWKKSLDVSREFLSGVSLHAHTHHSRESLSHLPHYIAQIPVVGTLFDRDLQHHQQQNCLHYFDWHLATKKQYDCLWQFLLF